MRGNNNTTNALRDSDYYIHLWLKEHSRSEHTSDAYRRDVNDFLSACGVPFQSVTVGDLNRYKINLVEYSLATRQRKIVALRSFFDYLNGLELTDINLSRFKAPGMRRQVNPSKLLTPAEILAIIEAAKPDREAYLFARLLYTTGARVSEAVGLRWRDLTPLDTAGEVILHGKGDKWRQVPVSSMLWDDLVEHRGISADADAIFQTIPDRHVAARLIAKLARAARIDKTVTPHSLRHACASHLLERGANVAAVRDQLGHSSLSTTNLYAHVSPGCKLADLLEVG